MKSNNFAFQQNIGATVNKAVGVVATVLYRESVDNGVAER